jgi:hypothetical protein
MIYNYSTLSTEEPENVNAEPRFNLTFLAKLPSKNTENYARSI